MADEPITLPETRKPTFFNQYLVTGFKISALPILGALVGLALAPAAVTTLLASPVLLYASYGLAGATLLGGAAAGAYYGRERIQENLAKGGERVISPPYLFNEGMAQGALNGLILTLGAVAAVAAFGIPALDSIFTASAETLTPWLIGGIAGAGIMGTTALSYIQGNDHYQQMARDYEVAKQLDSQRGSGIGLDALMSQVNAPAKEKPAPQAERVSAADMALIEELLAARAAEKAKAGRVNPEVGRSKGAG